MWELTDDTLTHADAIFSLSATIIVQHSKGQKVFTA